MYTHKTNKAIHRYRYITCIYRKQQKLSRKKVLQFIRYYHNVGKTFVVFEYYMLARKNKLINSRESIRDSWKIHEKREGFLPLNFCCLRYIAT